MKIISNFDDYYDEHQYNVSWEPSITWLRQAKSIDTETKYKVLSTIGKFTETVKYFDDYLSNLWSVDFFLIGAVGSLRKGVKISHKEYNITAYTHTGAITQAQKIGLSLPEHIISHVDKHFEVPVINADEPFLLLTVPLFVIHCKNRSDIIVNPNLHNYDYWKVDGRIFMKLNNYIDNVLMPLPPQPCYQALPMRICGRKWSSWNVEHQEKIF